MSGYLVPHTYLSHKFFILGHKSLPLIKKQCCLLLFSPGNRNVSSSLGQVDHYITGEVTVFFQSY